MDSYQLAIAEFVATIPVKTVFSKVEAEDYEEVAEALFKDTSKLDEVGSYLVFPDRESRNFNEAIRGIRVALNTQLRCNSGNVYLLGYG